MQLVLRLASLSMCYRDGASDIKVPEKELFKHQLHHRITGGVNLIEILSYSFTCCGCIVGPFIEYKDYNDFINKEGRYKNIPSTVIPGLKLMLQALGLIVIYLAF